MRHSPERVRKLHHRLKGVAPLPNGRDCKSTSQLAPEVQTTLDHTHPATKGDVLILIDPSAFAGETAALAVYRQRLSRPLAPERQAAVPGDGSRARRAAALTPGIELPQPLFENLTALEAA